MEMTVSDENISNKFPPQPCTTCRSDDDELGFSGETPVGSTACSAIITKNVKCQRGFSSIVDATFHDSVTKGLLGWSAGRGVACCCPQQA
jgi:hypothetical protein